MRHVLYALLLSGCTAASSASDLDSVASADTKACSIETSKLDEAAKKALRDQTYDAMFDAKTAACASSFHTAGPNNVGADKLVRIGSITKTYVAIATLKLVEAGSVELDKPVSTYLADLPEQVAPVTVRQLLQHTSGLFNYTNHDDFWAVYEKDPMHAYSPRALLDLALTKPVLFEPGAQWSYSNTNYIVLGMLLEKVEGRSVAATIRERVLEPNQLAHTFFDGLEPVDGVITPGYATDGTEVGHTYDVSWAWAAGAMVATPNDIGRFIELVGTGALLTPAMDAELHRGVPTPQPGLTYGLGVFLIGAASTAGAGPGIGHGGDIMGYHSNAFYFPESKLTIAGAVNSDKGSGNDVLGAALVALFTPATIAATPVVMPPKAFPF